MATAEQTGPPPGGVRAAYQRLSRATRGLMPKGLFARSLLIIITPVVVLQAAVVFVFTERNWQSVAERLSAAVVGDIAAIVDLVDAAPDGGFTEIQRIASERLRLTIDMLGEDALPAAQPKPFFSPLDRLLSRDISREIGKPFWVDTVGRSNLIEIRIKLDDGVLRVFARRNQANAASSLTLIGSMVATSIVLLGVAILFLRNQIAPILTLTAAVDNFGKGRPVPDFRPRGAREVRQAAIAFHDMRRRVERMIEQRTSLLAGVSHDLRTVLTRLRLQLAFIEETADVAAATADVDDMNRMLEGYLAFARGNADEDTMAVDMPALIAAIADERRAAGHTVHDEFTGDPIVRVRPQSFKRCLVNLIGNASRHADTVSVSARHADGHLTITVDDDGPGIPPEEREAVFKPFYRLDNARNLDATGTGLGLPTARDIARAHGGDVTLSESPAGGLRVTVTVPA